jgi:lipopolysaccharide transport system ATP-binding protein
MGGYMGNTAISVQRLSKRYSRGIARPEYYTLRETLLWIAKAPLRRYRRLSGAGQGDGEWFWALHDVSFEIKHGQAVAIVGPNGSGKSTLLRILSRITRPTSGLAHVYGRSGSLLEVGTGFHTELTGRENIYLSAAIRGMKKAEIRERFDEIVDFSGMEAFLDTPVKWYSSGMYVRLAFSVAAHLEPDLLFVDEVLAVGDADFQDKCLRKMQDVAESGRTVLLVSHNMAVVKRFCTAGLLLNNGELKLQTDNIEDLVQAYVGRGGNAALLPE